MGPMPQWPPLSTGLLQKTEEDRIWRHWEKEDYICTSAQFNRASGRSLDISYSRLRTTLCVTPVGEHYKLHRFRINYRACILNNSDLGLELLHFESEFLSLLGVEPLGLSLWVKYLQQVDMLLFHLLLRLGQFTETIHSCLNWLCVHSLMKICIFISSQRTTSRYHIE